LTLNIHSMIRTRIGQLLKIKDKNILADRKKLRRAKVDKRWKVWIKK